MLEAEQAVLSGAATASNQPGYTGTGFADYINTFGDYIEWTINVTAASSFSLKFRYANGGTVNRPLQLKVNESIINASLAFSPSGSWATWAVSLAMAGLIAGVNKIRLTTTGSNGPNVNNLAFIANSGFQSLQKITAAPSLSAQSPNPFSVQVYPNPVMQKATILVTGSSNLPNDVGLIDVSGRIYKSIKVLHHRLSTIQLPVNDVAPGVYIVVIKQGALKANAKLIIEKK